MGRLGMAYKKTNPLKKILAILLPFSSRFAKILFPSILFLGLGALIYGKTVVDLRRQELLRSNQHLFDLQSNAVSASKQIAEERAKELAEKAEAIRESLFASPEEARDHLERIVVSIAGPQWIIELAHLGNSDLSDTVGAIFFSIELRHDSRIKTAANPQNSVFYNILRSLNEEEGFLRIEKLQLESSQGDLKQLGLVIAALVQKP